MAKNRTTLERCETNGPNCKRVCYCDCFACGLPVCSDEECSRKMNYYSYGTQRICVNCQEDHELPHGRTKMKIKRVKDPLGDELVSLAPGDTFVFPLGAPADYLYVVLDKNKSPVSLPKCKILTAHLRTGRMYLQNPSDRVAPVDAEVTYTFSRS